MLINLANEKNQDMDEMTHTVNDQKQTINDQEKRIIKLKERNALVDQLKKFILSGSEINGLNCK